MGVMLDGLRVLEVESESVAEQASHMGSFISALVELRCLWSTEI